MNEKLDAWNVETTDLTARVAAAIGSSSPSVETELLQELRALRREIAELRGEVQRLRSSGSARRLVPFAPAEDRVGLS